MGYNENDFLLVSLLERRAFPICNQIPPKACLGSLKVVAHQI